jgi:hypothetical protein
LEPTGPKPTIRFVIGRSGLSTRAQRFEYDFAGVIIGPDLVWRDDRWQANPTASADTQVCRAANFDVLVRNVYKVLLTRGWSAASSIPPTLKPERFLQNSVFRVARTSSVRRQYLAFVKLAKGVTGHP